MYGVFSDFYCFGLVDLTQEVRLGAWQADNLACVMLWKNKAMSLCYVFLCLKIWNKSVLS